MLLILLNSCPAILLAAIGDAGGEAGRAVNAEEVPPGAALVGSLVLGLFAASLYAWVWLISRKVSGKPVLSTADKSPLPPWGLVDLFVAIGSLFVAGMVVSGLIRALGYADLFGLEPKPLPLVAVDFGLPMLLAVGLATWWLAASFRGGGAAWSLRDLKRDLVLGSTMYLLIAPLLLLLMAAATGVSGVEYDHPIVKVFDPSPLTILSGYFVAALVAPLAEEFLFRVLLQGYLQSVAAGGPLLLTTILMGRGRHPAAVSQLENAREFEATARSDSLADSHSAGVAHPPDAIDAGATARQPWWPLVVTGVLFGLAHYDYGVSWIPLIFFGWVLGWLYRRTGRIWPCVVAHACSNAFAVTMMSIAAAYDMPTP